MHSARWMMRASVGLATSQLHLDAKSNSRRRKDACIFGAHLEIDECVVKDQIEGLHPRSDGETTSQGLTDANSISTVHRARVSKEDSERP
jgi:hypothetical protein